MKIVAEPVVIPFQVACILSPLSLRDWGHEVAYCLDPDRHVLAFAKESWGSGQILQDGDGLPAPGPGHEKMVVVAGGNRVQAYPGRSQRLYV